MKKKIIIIGAGPAGLTAGYELLKNGYDITILEESQEIGGISKTVKHNGNHMDIGGHRFFSKITKVNDWWEEILQEEFLTRNRKSRILYERKFYDYPVSLNKTTVTNLGLTKMMKIGFSYLKSMFFKREEKSLEDFFINRFGKELYETFFKDYTHKVWGVPCTQIDALFGHQRIKGLSIAKVLLHAVKKIFSKTPSSQTETSLIEAFLYPKYGPGQLWETVANKIISMGGKIEFHQKVVELITENKKITTVNTSSNNSYTCDYAISSMPIKDLVCTFNPIAPANISQLSNDLQYRDFITVGLLLDRVKIKNLDDNWIYIQESDVKIGRLQIFNNWSPYLVQDSTKSWFGLEYFCQENDHMWNMPQAEFIEFAIQEMIKLGFFNKEDVLDSVQIKVKKAYPSYFGSYDQFDTIKNHLNEYENLLCVGRNGQHRYNNMDHSMMSSFEAVDVIMKGTSKERLWSVNTEKEYHESK